MTLRANGSYIGYNQYTTNVSATGVWSLDEVGRRMAESNWPQPPSASKQTVITVGNNGYYNYNGWMDNVEYSSSSSAANMGSATGDKALLNADVVTGLSGIGNPGRTGFSLWANGSNGNAGWTKLEGETTYGGTTYTGYILRADCTYVADSSNLSNWNQHWQNNTGGYSGTHTYYGTHLRQMTSQGNQSTPTSGTVTFDFT